MADINQSLAKQVEEFMIKQSTSLNTNTRNYGQNGSKSLHFSMYGEFTPITVRSYSLDQNADLE